MKLKTALAILFLASSAAAEADTIPGLGSFAYDGSGNIRRIGLDTFAYDRLGRIDRVILGSTENREQRAYTYDSYGNIKQFSDYSNGVLTGTYKFGVDKSTNRLSVQKEVVNGSVMWMNYWGEYDAAGNMTRRGDSAETFTYDALDVMTRSTTATSTKMYIYTASDERLATFTTTATTQNSRWTVRDPEGRVLRRMSRDSEGHWRWEQDYVYRGGQLLAGEVATAAKTLHYHLDHLGTPRLVTGNGGVELGRYEYYPFGAERPRPGQHQDALKFTGHERDESNLDYMHARYYDPFMGRFLSVDPGRDWDEDRPQSWNRYAYSRNEPVNHFDPDGRRADSPKNDCAGISSGACGRANKTWAQHPSDPKFVKMIGKASTALIAGVVANPKSLYGVALGMLTGFTKGTRSQSTNNPEPIKKVILNAFDGAINGLITGSIGTVLEGNATVKKNVPNGEYIIPAVAGTAGVILDNSFSDFFLQEPVVLAPEPAEEKPAEVVTPPCTSGVIEC